MAVRDLSRTIIEGGRHCRSTINRKLRNRRMRRMRFDAEGGVIGRMPNLSIACLYHHDRLAPLQRWLRSNVGRPWRKVFRELCERHDVRTTKGWHLRDHLRMELDRGWPWARQRWIVDGHGILREQPRQRYFNRRAAERREREAALEWAAGRRVIGSGHALFWTATVVVQDAEAGASRQGPRFRDKEYEYWAGLSDAAQAALRYVPARLTRASVGGEDARERRRKRHL